MSREQLDRWCDRGILGLVLGILVLGPIAMGGAPAVTFIVLQILAGLTLVLWAARLWLNPRPQLLWPPMCWAVIVFVLYAIARYFTADIEYVARKEVIRVLVYGFLFFVVLNYLHRQERVQLITLTLVGLAMVISWYAIYQFLANSDKVWWFVSPYKHRGAGTYYCPNHLAGFLEILLPLALTFTLTSRLKPVIRVFVGYSALVIVAGIAVTVSRGSWGATALALVVLFGVLSFRKGHRLASLVFFAVIVGGVLVLAPKSQFFKHRFNRTFGGERLDDDARLITWRPAMEIWQENFWWGAGPGLFDERFRAFRPEGLQQQPYRAHNDFLNTLTDWGVVGAAMVAAALGLLAVGVFKTWKVVRKPRQELGGRSESNRFAFVLGASIGLLALFFHSAVDFNMHIPANAILAITLMALLSSHLRFTTEAYWVKVRPWMSVAMTVLLVAGGSFFLGEAFRGASEQVWLLKAGSAEPYSALQITLLKRAFAVEPRNPQTSHRIGEALWRQSQEGSAVYADAEGDYQTRAKEAIEWFQRSLKLNPWNGYAYLGCGLCLDWLGQFEESEKYFARAEELDPKGYYMMEYIGLHWVELGNYAAARPWFERSIRLDWHNPVAHNYLSICNLRLREAATNDLRALLQPQKGTDHAAPSQ